MDISFYYSVLRYFLLPGFLLLTACQPDSSNSDTSGNGALTLYSNATVIVGDGQVISGGAVLVDGENIVSVGQLAAMTVPQGTSEVDLGGKTVMPAMIDAHAHLGYEGYRSWGGQHYSRATLIDHLQRYAYYGFTAAFSAGSDPDDLAIALQRDQDAGTAGGAKFLFAAGMGPPGQGPNDQFLGHVRDVETDTGMTILRGLASPEQARLAAREVADKGVPFIKIWVDDRGGSQDKLQPDIYRALADEAQGLGLTVLVHQQFADDMPDLLDAGVGGFLHGRLGPDLDRDLATQIAASNAFLVPNLGLGELRRERVADDPFLQEIVPGDVLARLRASFDARPTVQVNPAREQALRDSMAHLLAAGVDIVLGTDAGAVPDHFFGYTGHRELEIFVRLGVSTEQALMAATSVAARHLGLEDRGTLEPGKRADFVVLNANPLEDIRNTRTIDSVYLAGARVDRAGLRAGWLEE